MIIVGAGGHAKELFQIIIDENISKSLFFFDNINFQLDTLYQNYIVLHTFKEVTDLFKVDNRFILGVGGSSLRESLYLRFSELGGEIISIFSKTSYISPLNVELNIGLNIMHNAFISCDVYIGKCVIINNSSNIHHDVSIGDFTEIAPNCVVLGGARIGKSCFLGANSTILPKIRICDRVVIGAGAVVTRDISNPGVYVGVPAIKINS